MKILIINGPNLNLLGQREPEIYGSQTFEDFLILLKEKFPEIHLHYFQSNIEGEIINELHHAGKYDGIVLNAAAYTHTSIAIADAVAAIAVPVIEVHISNPYTREAYRHHSFISSKAKAVICGMGLQGYTYAVDYFLKIK